MTNKPHPCVPGRTMFPATELLEVMWGRYDETRRPMTVAQLVDLTGRAKSTVLKKLQHLAQCRAVAHTGWVAGDNKRAPRHKLWAPVERDPRKVPAEFSDPPPPRGTCDGCGGEGLDLGVYRDKRLCRSCLIGDELPIEPSAWRTASALSFF